MNRREEHHEELQRDLESVRRDARAVIAAEDRQRAVRPTLQTAAWLSVLFGALYLGYLGTAQLLGISAPAAPLPVLVATVFGLPGLYFAIRVLATGTPVPDDGALAAADARHRTNDRLRTAAAFLAREDRDAFMEAALEDAAPFAKAARHDRLPAVAPPPPISGPARGGLALAGLLFVAAAIAPGTSFRTPYEPGSRTALTADLDPVEPPERKPRQARAQNPRPEPIQPRPRAQTIAPEPGNNRKDTQLSSSTKKTRGALGSGQSADAASSSGDSAARGAPSSQAQASKAGKKPKKKTKKRKKRDPKDPDEEANKPKKPEQDSGATAGRGAASGSNKSPSASPWSSKDQVTSDDEDDLEDDEEVDDEFDNSDARGGVQPHLRDRRPPVNRDLGIGFGNGKNPDANGRGGPSAMKKSRGVAALVLGVPIPDHVKGRPNPGKTKITQERVEPQPEQPQPHAASPRTPRQAPVGSVPEPALQPWMRELIRTYFRDIRAAAQAPGTTPSENKSGV